eukprot:9592673-Alexandrium_andersonii.AAC.1
MSRTGAQRRHSVGSTACIVLVSLRLTALPSFVALPLCRRVYQLRDSVYRLRDSAASRGF